MRPDPDNRPQWKLETDAWIIIIATLILMGMVLYFAHKADEFPGLSSAMVALVPGKTIRRQTATLDHGTPLVVELHPRHLTLRVKGERSFVAVPYDAIRDLGRKLEARLNPQPLRRRA